MRDGCPRLWEVDAYREGRLGAKDASRFERHARLCVACATRMENDERLGRLMRELPSRDPEELETRRVRAEVMRALATSRATGGTQRWRLAAALAMTAVLGGLVAWRIGLGSHPLATHRDGVAGVPALVAYAGAVVALVDSRWTQSREGDVERVQMESG
ncbi:MAG TPA: hypothetical protein VIY73_01935, partial [Polyangiaceae bacterium]